MSQGLGGGQEVWPEEVVRCSAPQWERWRDPARPAGW